MDWKYIRDELDDKIQKKIMELVSELKKEGIIKNVEDENSVIGRFEYIPKRIIYDNSRYGDLHGDVKDLLKKHEKMDEKIEDLNNRKTAIYELIESERMKSLKKESLLANYDWFVDPDINEKIRLRIRIPRDEIVEFRGIIENPLRYYSEWLNETIYIFSNGNHLNIRGEGCNYYVDFDLDGAVPIQEYREALQELGIEPDFSNIKEKIEKREKEIKDLQKILNKWSQ